MNKMMTLAACTLVATATFAEVLRDEDMQKAAGNPKVEAVLESDGVCLRRSDADGSLQVIARDSAAYGIGTPRDIRNKTEVAEMKAKKRLVSFMNSKVEAYRQHGSRQSETSVEAGDGNIVTTLTTAQEAEMFESVIRESVSGNLTGVVVLKTVKVPAEGSKTSGMVQVTLGISTKTLAAATEAHNMITDSFNARRKAGEPAHKANGDCAPANGGSEANKTNDANVNKPEVRVTNTLF